MITHKTVLLCHSDKGRSNDSLAEHVSVLHDGDHESAFNAISRFMRNRLMEVGIELPAFGIDTLDPFTVQDVLQLASDQLDTACP